MAHTFLPATGQIDLSELADNAEHGRARQALVRTAQHFVREVSSRQGTRKVAYSPVKGEGAQFLTGASRVVAETLYSLFVKAPADTLSESIVWAANMAPDLMPLDKIDIGSGRQGEITPNTYKAGLEYFEESLAWAIEANRAAKAKRRREENRRSGFRRASEHLTQSVGSATRS